MILIVNLHNMELEERYKNITKKFENAITKERYLVLHNNERLH